MAVDERARHELHGRLDDVLGREEATTLMSLPPPVGWADVTTKHDLDSLRIELRAESGNCAASFAARLASFAASSTATWRRSPER